MPLQIIPVLDVKAGTAVHAVGGRREDYRPLRSRLHPESDPVGMARAYCDVLRLPNLYLADLDAIGGSPPALDLYRALQRLGLSLWVDAGIRDAASIPTLVEVGVSTVVVGLESISGPEELAKILTRVDPERIVLSLDLREGLSLVPERADWPSTEPAKIAALAVQLGLRRLLLLDLARVGTGRGTGTTPLLQGLVQRHPGLALAVGGGISGTLDVLELERAGASAVLLGSTLHDGRIGPRELAELSVPQEGASSPLTRFDENR